MIMNGSKKPQRKYTISVKSFFKLPLLKIELPLINQIINQSKKNANTYIAVRRNTTASPKNMPPSMAYLFRPFKLFAALIKVILANKQNKLTKPSAKTTTPPKYGSQTM